MADCRLYWAFDDGVALPSGGSLRGCGDLPFLESPDTSFAFSPYQHACLVKQVAAQNGQPTAGAEGWYYDDQVSECPGAGAFRFTDSVRPLPDGLSVRVVCENALTKSGAGTLALTDPNQCKLPTDSAKHADSIGTSCTPDAVPSRGFDEREAYVETNSMQCSTGVCLDYHLRGDPSNVCGTRSSSPECAVAQDIKDRVYCSCRCDAPANDPGTLCACGQGFACVDVLDSAPPGIRGSYCVRKATVSDNSTTSVTGGKGPADAGPN